MVKIKNYTPLKNFKPIKKWLIYGNIFLVIIVAVIGAVYYDNILITTKQKAAFDCNALIPGDCKKKQKEYIESGKQEEDQTKKYRKERDERKMREGEYIPPGGCPSNYITCNIQDIGGRKHKFCIPSDGSEGGCNSSAVRRGITVKTGGGGPGLGGWRCIIGKNGYTGGPCLERNSVQTVGTGKPPNCFCGIIQIDGGQWAGTYQSTCGCNKEEEVAIKTSTPIGTIIPTPTEVPTETPTEIPTETPTEVPTNSPTPTDTPTPTATDTPTPTNIPNQPTNTPTATPVQSIPSAGSPKTFLLLIPVGIILLSLLL